MKAWIFQDHRQKQQLGSRAPWSVGWLDPETGKRRSKRIGQKTAAKLYCRRLEGEVAAGTYNAPTRKTWGVFRTDYEKNVLSRSGEKSQVAAKAALDTFERLIKPGKISAIRTETIDDFVAKRRKETYGPDKRPLSVATINKELRYVRAALRKATEWRMLPQAPRVKMLKEPKKLATFVSPEEFSLLYDACETATRPGVVPNVSPCQWWRALLMFGYMTGWRISAILSLRWDDVNLERGTALSRAEDNKGKRDVLTPLHPTIVEELQGVSGSFGDYVFPWSGPRRALWREFIRIQKAAGVSPTEKPHYGFHDLRRGFATMNAQRLTAVALQQQMQHTDYRTTQGYIAIAGQLNAEVENLFVPAVNRKVSAG